MDWHKLLDGLRQLAFALADRLGRLPGLIRWLWRRLRPALRIIVGFARSSYVILRALLDALWVLLKPIYAIVRNNRLSAATVIGGSILIVALLLSIEERKLPQPDPAFDDRPRYVIGAVVSLTGKYARQGNEMLQGYKAATELINEAGGIRIEDVPHNLALEVYDDESSVLRVPDVTRRLVGNGSSEVLLAPYSSALAKPMIAVTVPVGIPVVVPIASAAGLGDVPAVSAFLLQTPPRRHLQLAADALLGHFATVRGEFAKDERKKRKGPFANGARPKVLVSAAADLHSQNVIAGVLEVLGQDETIEIEQIDLQVTDDQERKALNQKLAKADAVFVSAFSAGATKLMETIASKGISIPFIALTHCDIANIGTEEPTAAQGALCAVHWQPEARFKGSEPLTAEVFAKRYFEDNAQVPSHRAAAAAAAIQLIASALHRMQHDEALAMGDALATSRIDTLYGPLAFDRNGTNTNKPMVISQIQLSRFIPVAPAPIAAASINFIRPQLAASN